MPSGQLFVAGDPADRLWEFAMPLDDVAADEQPDALIGRRALCGGELLHVPQSDPVDQRRLRP